jgi:transposase InsO family protein
MEKAKRARKAETPKQPSLRLRLRAPYLYPNRYLIRDRDGAYGEIFLRRVRSIGIRDRPTSPRSPWQNACAGRLIGSIRRECIDNVVVFGERHLRHVLLSYMNLAVEQIVDGYVRLNDREALADLKAHREDLLAQLRAQLGGWFDVSRSVSQMEEDVSQIEAGLARLDGAVASPPSGSDAAHLS